MGDEKNIDLINLYKTMIELDNDILKDIVKNKSWILEFLTVDELATLILLTSNDIDNIKEKIKIVGDELAISRSKNKLNESGVYC